MEKGVGRKKSTLSAATGRKDVDSEKLSSQKEKNRHKKSNFVGETTKLKEAADRRNATGIRRDEEESRQTLDTDDEDDLIVESSSPTDRNVEKLIGGFKDFTHATNLVKKRTQVASNNNITTESNGEPSEDEVENTDDSSQHQQFAQEEEEEEEEGDEEQIVKDTSSPYKR